MNCPSCGSKNLDNSQFCSECGGMLPAETSAPGGTGVAAGTEFPVFKLSDDNAPPSTGAADAASSPPGGRDTPSPVRENPPTPTTPATSKPPASSPPPAPPPQKKGPGLGLILGCTCGGLMLLCLVMAVVFFFMAKKYVTDHRGTSIISPSPGSSAAETPINPKFVNATMCGRLGPSKEPLENKTTFPPSSRFYCSVEVKDLEEGDRVTAKWYKGSEMVKEFVYDVKKTPIDYIGFSLSRDKGWPIGDDYRVDIFINDEEVASREFDVEEGAGPSTTKSDTWKKYLKAAVICRSMDEDYNPVDPTDVYGPTDPFNCSVEVKNLPPGTRANGKWYFGSQFIDEKEIFLKAGGSGCVGFFCNPKKNWPVGEYRVEIYLNDNLVEEKKFNVED